MNKKTWLYLLPFIIFLLGALFLFKGLYSDPTKLESVMVDKEVPVFTLQDIYDLGKQHDRSILKGRPMLLKPLLPSRTGRARRHDASTLKPSGSMRA